MKIIQAEILAEQLRTMKDIKGVVGLSIARNLRMIDDELKEYYELKSELFKKYGEEQGGNLVINKMSDNYPLFLKEMAPAEEQDIEFNFRKVSEDDMIDSGLTSEQMYLLMDFMVKGEEE